MKVQASIGTADALADAHQRFDIGHDGSHGAVGSDAHAAIDDFAHQGFDVRHRVDAGSRQADVGGMDAEILHQMQQTQLLLERRIAYRRAL